MPVASRDAPPPALRPRLLAFPSGSEPHVREDLARLRESFDVMPFAFGKGGGLPGLLSNVRRQRRWLEEVGADADLALAWGADVHLALPARWAERRGVPLAVVLHEADTACHPALRPGALCSPWRTRVVRYALQRAALLLPTSEAVLDASNPWGTEGPSRQGLRTHLPRLQTPARVLRPGYDADAWPLGPTARPRTVCAVAPFADIRAFRAFGGDTLLGVARQLPETRIALIGVEPAFGDALLDRTHVPGNVRLVPPLPPEKRSRVLGGASVIAHLHRVEGPPHALAEAMLCGCVPAVSAVGAAPELAGRIGAIAETPEDAAEAIQRALDLAPSQRTRARSRIAEGYGRDQRHRDLFAHLDGLLSA